MRVLCVCLCVLPVAGCGKMAPSKMAPAPPGEAASWTHAELLARLESKGLKHRVVARRTGGAFGMGPSASLWLDGFDMTEADHVREISGGTASHVTIDLEKTAAEAREKAGVLGEQGFAWGRFVVEGRPPFVALVKKAISGDDVSDDVAALKRRREEDRAKADAAWKQQLEKMRENGFGGKSP